MYYRLFDVQISQAFLLIETSIDLERAWWERSFQGKMSVWQQHCITRQFGHNRRCHSRFWAPWKAKLLEYHPWWNLTNSVLMAFYGHPITRELFGVSRIPTLWWPPAITPKSNLTLWSGWSIKCLCPSSQTGLMYLNQIYRQNSGSGWCRRL